MFNFKRKPKTKRFEDFELLEINLIKDLPIEYAYVMSKSNRIIQKNDKKALLKIMKENIDSIVLSKWA